MLLMTTCEDKSTLLPEPDPEGPAAAASSSEAETPLLPCPLLPGIRKTSNEGSDSLDQHPAWHIDIVQDQP